MIRARCRLAAGEWHDLAVEAELAAGVEGDSPTLRIEGEGFSLRASVRTTRLDGAGAVGGQRFELHGPLAARRMAAPGGVVSALSGYVEVGAARIVEEVSLVLLLSDQGELASSLSKVPPPQPLGLPALTRLVLGELARVRPEETHNVSEAGVLESEMAGVSTGRINLRNFAASLPGGLPPEVIALRVRGVAARKGPAVSPAGLLPIVKGADFATGAPPTVLRRPFGDALLQLWAIDAADQLRVVTVELLERLGGSLEALDAQASENLAARAQRIRLRPEGTTGAGQLRLDGVYESSLLLHPPLWNELAAHFGSDPVAFVPARGLLLVAPADALGLCIDFAQRTRDEAQGPYVISARPQRWRGGEWRPV